MFGKLLVLCVLLPWRTFSIHYTVQVEYKVEDDKSMRDCDFGPDPDGLTQEQFYNRLTSNKCGYDSHTKPLTKEPLNVTVKLEIGHVETLGEFQQFKLHMLAQFSYIDSRLAYSNISPKRGVLLGEAALLDKLWIPHVVVNNERDTFIMGLENRDILVRIKPNGEVRYMFRMATSVYCWMNLKKFPFDDQVCDVQFTSWTYHQNQLQLKWADVEPVRIMSELHFPEFSLIHYWTNTSTEKFSFSSGPDGGPHSKLNFVFKIHREIGFYILDYFLPSALLVCISWTTFWLQANDAAPRMTLGTSTMLSLITLASWRSKNLPKVSYIKANDVWFLGCTVFIFASLAEFAFVNVIWRRKKKVELVKADGKHILKRTFVPKLAKKELEIEKANNTVQYKSDDAELNAVWTTGIKEHIPQNVSPRRRMDSTTLWATMTPQEIAIWIDRKSRIAFPVAFALFNIAYWSFVYTV